MVGFIVDYNTIRIHQNTQKIYTVYVILRMGYK